MKLKTIEKDGIKITAAFTTEKEVNEKIKMRVEYDHDGGTRSFEAYPDKDKNGRFTIDQQFDYAKADRDFEKKVMAMEHLGNKIAEMRAKASISQLQLAKGAGIQQAHLSRIENGKYMPRVDIVARIAGVLGCTIDELVG